MSAEASCSQEEDIEYVLDNSALVATHLTEKLQETQYDDVMYTEDGQAILIRNGQYFIPADNETIVLQDSDENYGPLIINEGDESQSSEVTQSNVIQYIQEDENGEQVIYEITNENALHLLKNQGIIAQSDEDTTNSVDILLNEPALKRIKVEHNEDDTQDISFQILNEQDTIILDNNELEAENGDRRYKFAVLKNDKLQVHTIDQEQIGSLDDLTQANIVVEENDEQLKQELAAFEDSIKMQPEPIYLDVGSIAGKNLLTGQIVTLDSYLKKIGKEPRKQPNSRKRSTQNVPFINQKLNLGTTSNGKRLVGKIISIQKPMESETSEQTQSESTSGSCDIILQALKDSENRALIEQNTYSDDSSVNMIESIQSEESQESQAIITENFVVEEGQIMPSVQEEVNFKNPDPNQESILSLDGEALENGDSNEILSEVFVVKDTLSEDHVNFIKRTLEGLMKMDSIKRKLADRLVQVKLVEKLYGNYSKLALKKSIYVAVGKMETVSDSLDGTEENVGYCFSLDPSMDVFDDEENNAEGTEVIKKLVEEVSNMTSVTSITIVNAINKFRSPSVQVKFNKNLNYPSCCICNKLFRTMNQLNNHFYGSHNNPECLTCKECNKTLPNILSFLCHKKTHSILCQICGRWIGSYWKLRRHMLYHCSKGSARKCVSCKRMISLDIAEKNVDTVSGDLYCDRCMNAFKYEKGYNYPKPVKLHCSICKREFTRYSNLVRHEEIHKGVGALYKCEICGCSYNFVSSLTRHMVQNHINPT